MDMVKVDPKLFVMCRLCLENMGMYQITPIVKQQIKYCFDIEVDPFDGLPQLICSDCETILNDYHTKKKIFIGRQNALQARLAVRREVEEESQALAQKEQQEEESRASPQQDAVSSSQPSHEVPSVSPIQRPRPKKRKSRIISTSSSSGDERGPDDSSSIVVNHKTKNKKAGSWAADYDKLFSCKICGRCVSWKRSIRVHMKKHSDLISKYENIINRPCILSVTKIDGKPNKTGSSNAVMISPDKVIGPERDNTFNTIYCAKEDYRLNDIENESDDVQEKQRSRKRRRWQSGSSTDTVVLKDESKRENKPNQELDCINIDDSSNSSCTSAKSDTDNIQIKEDDKRAIDNLIKVSHNRFILRKHETSNTESNLKELLLTRRKLLNMGRKIIQKQGLASTGLLRFLERQNLEIKWIPTNVSTAAYTDENLIHVMPKLRAKEEVRQGSVGWKYIPEQPVKMKDSKNSIHNTKPNNIQNMLVYKVTKKKPQPEATLQETKPEPVQDQKLLNANPVANPKQLPKKLNPTESTMFVQPVAVPNAIQIAVQNRPQKSQSICINLDTNSDNETCMPIITSTKSLAVPSVEQNGNNKMNGGNTSNNPITVEEDKPAAPRIKVKPVAELMSERALQFFGNNQDEKNTSAGWQPGGKIAPATNAIMHSPNPTVAVSNVVTVTGTPLTIKSVQSAPGTMQIPNRGLVILDTAELPNTTTDSPFRYVKNLLQIHNIVLLNSDQPPPSSYACLIKFKLMFLRDSVDSPVTLSLAVFCESNQFCLVVKDSTQTNIIDLARLSATWQWEILKTFVTRLDIIQKMAQNAQKIGRDVHDNTQNFLCLLKSIKCTAIS